MYFYQPVFTKGPQLVSSDVLAHLRARRVRVGGFIKLFDGKGQVGTAKIMVLDKRKAECDVLSIEKQQPEHQPRLVLGLAKLPTVEFILQKSVEIGVREILLLVCENTPIKFNQAVFDQKKERLERIIITACEQSENVFVPTLGWRMFSEYESDAQTVMLHPYAKEVWSSSNRDNTQVSDVMVGPEGGFTDSEVSCGAKLYKLNTGILRSDTAAIASLLLCKL